MQIESGRLQTKRLSTAPKVVDGPSPPTLVDWKHVEGDRSKRHQRSEKQGGKSRSGPLYQKYRGSVAPISVTSSSSAAARSTNGRHAPAGLFQFHSPEVATNSNTSLPAEASATSRWPTEAERLKPVGLVRRKSDLGPIAESVKVATVNGDGTTSKDRTSGSLRPPNEYVHITNIKYFFKEIEHQSGLYTLDLTIAKTRK